VPRTAAPQVLDATAADADALARLQAERAATETHASAKVTQLQNLQLNSLLMENAELLTQVLRTTPTGGRC
jgi:hypothetical protein